MSFFQKGDKVRRYENDKPVGPIMTVLGYSEDGNRVRCSYIEKGVEVDFFLIEEKIGLSR